MNKADLTFRPGLSPLRAGRAPDRAGGAAPRQIQFPALRRRARSYLRGCKSDPKILANLAPRFLRRKQSRHPLHRARGSQGRRAAGGQSSRPLQRSVDVDPRHRPRPPHRPAGSLHAILRHRFQLRRSGRARRGSIRLPLHRRGDHRRRALLAHRRAAQAKQNQPVHPLAHLDPQGQLRCRAVRKLHQRPTRAPPRSRRTFKTSRASGPPAPSR